MTDGSIKQEISMHQDDLKLFDMPARYAMKEHIATRHHFDLRLEYQGILISFVLPDGPSLSPHNQMPAVHVEDHKVSRIYFEGIIRKGWPGAGPVSLWDRGCYRNITMHNGEPASMEQALQRGYLEICLEGEKLRGGFSLRRVHSMKGEDWVFLKLQDEFADETTDVVRVMPLSVKSRQTIEQIARGKKRPVMYSGQISFDL